MIIPVLTVFVAFLPVLLGGRLIRLADVHVRNLPLIMSTLLVQIVIIELLPGPQWLLRVIHVGTYVTAGWFIWSNWRIPGAVMMASGAACNGVTIAVNHGVLPANPHAMRVAGLHSSSSFANSAVEQHPKLAFLGDVFAIPASWPLSNVFSVGDVLIIAGVAWTSLRICGTWWIEPWLDPDRLDPDQVDPDQETPAAEDSHAGGSLGVGDGDHNGAQPGESAAQPWMHRHTE